MSDNPEEAMQTEILNNLTEPYDLIDNINLLKGLIDIAKVTSRDSKQIKANEKTNVDRIVALETRIYSMEKLCDNLHKNVQFLLRESRKQNLIMFGLPASILGVNLVDLVVSTLSTIDKKFTIDCILKAKHLGQNPEK